MTIAAAPPQLMYSRSRAGLGHIASVLAVNCLQLAAMKSVMSGMQHLT